MYRSGLPPWPKQNSYSWTVKRRGETLIYYVALDVGCVPNDKHEIVILIYEYYFLLVYKILNENAFSFIMLVVQYDN